MFDAAISRIFLGVHWRFDAFASNDVLASPSPNADGTTAYKAPKTIKYQTMGPRAGRPGQLYPIGGVPLGVGVANDIFVNNLKPTPEDKQPVGRNKSGDFWSPTGGPSMPPRASIKANTEDAQAKRRDSAAGLSFVVQNGHMTPNSRGSND